MTPKHTPLPWLSGDYEPSEHFRDLSLHRAILRNDDLGLIAVTGPSGDEQTEYDTRFILRACNNHYKLLEALKALLACTITDNGEQSAAACIDLANEALSEVSRDSQCPHCHSFDVCLQEKVHDGDNVVEVYECRQCKHTSVRER